MHRNDLLRKLADYEGAWPDESETIQQFSAFVTDHPDCFERHLSIGHVTGSAWVVNQAGTHVLLTHHKKLNKWLQLGGHVDGNADILDAALREAREESGLNKLEPVGSEIFDIDIHLIPERKQEAAHYHHDIRFVFQATGSETYIVSDESHDLAWVEIRNLRKFTDEESMLRMARKWLA
jgi:8-oxo-dGTP pyrophosphatase MutT (NUDIX family)